MLYFSTGRSEWPDQGKSFSHVNRWFFFLNSQVPFSAVGNKYARKSVPISKSNVSLSTDMKKRLNIYNIWRKRVDIDAVFLLTTQERCKGVIDRLENSGLKNNNHSINKSMQQFSTA